MLTCEGQTVTPDLDSRAPAHIERRQSHASAAVSIARLEAPEGSQLLLVANENFCTGSRRKKLLTFTNGSCPYDRRRYRDSRHIPFLRRGERLPQPGDIKLHPLLIQLLA